MYASGMEYIGRNGQLNIQNPEFAPEDLLGPEALMAMSRSESPRVILPYGDANTPSDPRLTERGAPTLTRGSTITDFLSSPE